MNASVSLSVPATSSAAPSGYRQLPRNIEAEQTLLGLLLIRNDVLLQISDFLLPQHFFEPVHQRIYDAICKYSDKGMIATPVTLKQYFERDEALTELGGAQYLAKMASMASIIVNARDLAKVIYEQALKRNLIAIGEESVNKAYENDINSDALRQLEEIEQKLFTLASEGVREKAFQSIRQSLTGALQFVERAFKHQSDVTGVPSKLDRLDNLLGGFQNSDLIILAGRPSMGKTALATNIAYQAAKHFKRVSEEDPSLPLQSVGFFSLEMSAEQLASRILADVADVNSHKLRKGDLTHEEFAHLVHGSQQLSQMPFFIDDTPALSISAVRTRARRLKRQHHLGLLVIDYLQLMRGSSQQSASNRVLEISEITQGLKAIAKELDIPVIALSQLSRAVEQRDDKRPQLSDLRESGSIEQDADVVMFVFREEYYEARRMPREDDPKFAEWQAKMEKIHGLAEVIVAKQRHGPIGNVTLQFHADKTRFDNLADDRYLPERME
jgi:replicative DNA helicase